MNLLKLIVTVAHICSQKRVEDLTIFFQKSTMYLWKTLLLYTKYR